MKLSTESCCSCWFSILLDLLLGHLYSFSLVVVHPPPLMVAMLVDTLDDDRRVALGFVRWHVLKPHQWQHDSHWDDLVIWHNVPNLDTDGLSRVDHAIVVCAQSIHLLLLHPTTCP